MNSGDSTAGRRRAHHPPDVMPRPISRPRRWRRCLSRCLPSGGACPPRPSIPECGGANSWLSRRGNPRYEELGGGRYELRPYLVRAMRESPSGVGFPRPDGSMHCPNVDLAALLRSAMNQGAGWQGRSAPGRASQPAEMMGGFPETCCGEGQPRPVAGGGRRVGTRPAPVRRAGFRQGRGLPRRGLVPGDSPYALTPASVRATPT